MVYLYRVFKPTLCFISVGHAIPPDFWLLKTLLYRLGTFFPNPAYGSWWKFCFRS